MPSPPSKPLPRGLSCLACRRKKQRCDAAKPECSACVRAGRQSECIYTAPPRTKEQKMEERLALLEDIVATASLTTPLDANVGSITLTYPQTTPPKSVSKLPGPKLDSTLPVELSDHLVETFLSFAFHFDFPLSIPKFIRRHMYPEDDPRRPHPALVNAMHLVACHWSDRDLRSYELLFLERARQHLQESLSRVDRMMDFLVATVLVARYHLYCGKGSMSELGIYTATSTIITAEALGLHRLRLVGDISDQSPVAQPLLAPAQSVLEQMERVNVWWSVYILSRNASLIGGDAAHLDDKDITTPWPQHQRQTLSRWMPDPCFREDDETIGMKAKGSALLHRAGRHAVRTNASVNIQQDATFWSQHRAILDALDAFRDSLPPLPRASECSEYLLDPEDCIYGKTISEGYKLAAKNHGIIYAHTCELGARLQIHGILSDSFESEHDLLLDSAHKLATMAGNLGMFEPKLIHPFCAMTWATGRRVLLRELKLLEATKAPAAVLNTVRSGIAVLAGAFNRLAVFFPRLKHYRDETDAFSSSAFEAMTNAEFSTTHLYAYPV